jgi:hypothetical protein
MKRALLPHRTSIRHGEYLSAAITHSDGPEDDISFRSFNLYMFRATFSAFPMILVLLAAVGAIILIDFGMR